MKEGEVKILRSGAEKTAKEHQKQIEAEHSKTVNLQEKIAAMERAAGEEKQRYRSEILFARHEHESAIRHQRAASQHPTTIKKPIALRSPVQNPAKKKGFQNSFLESSPSENKGGSLARTPAPSSKGKEKAIEPDFELDQEHNDMTEHEEFDEPRPQSARDRFVVFMFGHNHVPSSELVSSMHAMLNFRLPSSVHEDTAMVHRKACQQLFDCLGDPISSNLDVELQDRTFLSKLVLAILSFVDLFSQADILRELVISLRLLHDLLFNFHSFLFHHAIIVKEQIAALKSTYSTLVNIVQVEHRKAVRNSETEQSAKAKPPSRLAQLATKARTPFDLRNKFELQIEPVLLVAVEVLSVLAWRPDDSNTAK